MSDKYRTESVRAVIRDGDLILVEWLASKSISFLPGGTIETGENLRSALVRELDEELEGIELRVGRYLGKIGHHWKTDRGSDSCLNHFFEAEIIKNFGVKAREPGREIRWISLNDMEVERLKPPSLRNLLGDQSQIAWDLIDEEQ